MEIAAQHAETVSESSGMGMEERLFLNGIALHSCGVSPGNVERAAAIEADFADSGLTFWDGAAVTAGETSDTVIVELLVKRRVRLADLQIENLTEGRHRILCRYSTSENCSLGVGFGHGRGAE